MTKTKSKYRACGWRDMATGRAGMPAIMLIAVMRGRCAGGAARAAGRPSGAVQGLGMAVKNLATQCGISLGLGRLTF